MFKLLILLLMANVCFADEQIVDFEEKSLPVLNNELRIIDDNIDDNADDITTNADDITTNKGKVMMDASDTSGYLGTKVKNSIENDSDDLQLVGDESAPGNNKVYGTDGAGAKGWESVATELNTSNTVFAWSGNDSAITNYGLYVGSSLTPQMAGAGEYVFYGADNTSYTTMLQFKFKKIAGISTITIYARLWSASTNASWEAFLNVNIGGQANTVKSVTSQTPTWVTSSDIDVSGLTNDTVYDGIIQLKTEDANAEAYLSAITLIGS